MTEDDLMELLDLIRGEGRFALIGGAIRTYPGADAEAQALYEGCRTLECRGLIRRVWQRNDRIGAVVLFRALT